MSRSLKSRKKEAFTLIETVLALAIVGVLLLTVFGLMGVAISENQSAVARTGAANALSAIISDVRSVPATSSSTTSPVFSIQLPATGASTAVGSPNQFYVTDDDQPTVTVANAAYLVSYWGTGSSSTGTSPACQESSIRVVVSWPPNATYSDNVVTNHAQGSVETVIFLNLIK